MNVLMLLVFVGIVMVTLALVLFAWTLRDRTFDHSDRLALLPLADDAPPIQPHANAAQDTPILATSAGETAGTALDNDSGAERRAVDCE